MRNYLDIITEASSITKTKTDTDLRINPIAFDTATADQTLATIDPTAVPAELSDKIATHGMDFLRDLANVKPAETPVRGYTTIPKKPQNLPAVISKALESTEEADFRPTWHRVGSLPGMAVRAIEEVGKQIFGQFTDLPIREIRMMTTAMRLNPEVDVRKMMAIIRNSGTKEDEMDFDFSEHMPAYHAITPENHGQLWRAFGYEFFMMKDAGGHYIYSWPETDRELTDRTEVMEPKRLR